ncbi:MAG: SufE family protein [Verrucomicrobiota bacterium]
MTIEEKKNKLINNLKLIDDPMERLSYIISKGKKRPEIDNSLKIDAFKIEGCVSNLWIIPKLEEGKCFYNCDADAAITKGVASLLCDFYSGFSPDDILSIDPSFLADAGVTQHISPNRSNGLANAGRAMMQFAISCQKKSS